MKQLLAFIAAISFLSLAAQNPIKIKQIESSDSITLRYDTTFNYWRAIAIPFAFKVIYKSSDNLWISGSNYYTIGEFSGGDDYAGWYVTLLKLKVGEEYVFPRYARYYEIPDTCYYWAGKVHIIQPKSDIQDSLAIYLQQIREGKGQLINETGAYSLPVGTLSEFKAKHPQLVERLLRNDSISFKVYRKQPSKYVDAIKMPIEY